MEDRQPVIDDQAWMPSRGMWVAAAIGGITVIAIITYALLYGTTMEKPVTSYGECVEAGGEVAESSPEQCFVDGKSYTNSEDGKVVNSDDYIGMTEQAALDQAQRAGVPHRVVERDGQPLPATMDFVQGRVNFHIKDGKVYSVYVENL